MKKVVVIGANRGLGLGFTKKYLEQGHSVVATYRNESGLQELNKLKTLYPNLLTLKHLNLSDGEAAIQEFAAQMDHLDLLILNAGVTGSQDGKPLSYKDINTVSNKDLQDAFFVNALAPRMLIQALGTKLSDQEDACVVYLSTPIGIPQNNQASGFEAYAASKAAGNSLIWERCKAWMSDWVKKHPKELIASPGAFAISPGWVKTDMGGPNGKLTIEESISKMVDVIEHVIANKKFNGVYDEQGKMITVYDEPKSLKMIFEAKIKAEQAMIAPVVDDVEKNQKNVFNLFQSKVVVPPELETREDKAKLT